MLTVPINHPSLSQALAKGLVPPDALWKPIKRPTNAQRPKNRPSRPDSRSPLPWSIALTLPCRVISEANQRGHWAVSHRRAEVQGQALKVALHAAGLIKHVPPLPVVTTWTRIGPRPMDDDNLARAFKALRDHMAKWLGVDDGDDCVSWLYEQRTGTPGVMVRIEGGADVNKERNAKSGVPNGNATDTVPTVLDLRNRYILIASDGNSWCWGPRWLPVRVVEVGPPWLVVHANAEDDSVAIEVKVKTCQCGQRFAVRGSDPFPYCRDCDRKLLSEARKRFRQRERASLLRLTCSVCREEMEPKRRTKKFCSPKCRLTHFRQGEKQSEPEGLTMPIILTNHGG